MIRRLITMVCLLALTANICAQPRWGDAYWRDSVPDTMRKDYISYGQRYQGKDWKSLPATAFAEFKKSGNRTHYEGLMFAKRRQLAALVIAELMEGQHRFTPDIVSGLLSTLEETWWGLPAHYRTELPRTEDQNVDLFNAETASLVAWTRYVMATELDAFSPLLTKRIDAEVARRILQPAVKGNYWWKTAGMNWNPWICSNWLACVLFCEHDDQRRAEAIGQIQKACDAFMAAYPADGGCDEGPHYWDRAAASLFETQYLLHSHSLASHLSPVDPKLLAMEAYIYKMYIGHDYAVNFADAHGNRAMLNVNIAYPYGLLTGDRMMCQYAAYVGRQNDILNHPARLYDTSGNWPSLSRELIFLSHLQPFLKETPHEPQLRNVWLPDLQIMTAREPFVAMKGGHNGESHNHNDVGSFVVYSDGEPLLIDPGVGEYTSKTFSQQRYEIWTMQSDYHNLPRINGQSQRDGKQYAARVISYQPGQLTLDISDAYPKDAQVCYWKRTVKTGSKHQVEVTEDYALEAYKAPTQLMLMTPIAPQIVHAGTVNLGSYRLVFDDKQLAVETEDISPLLDATLHQLWGDHLYRIVLTVKAPSLKGKLKYYIRKSK